MSYRPLTHSKIYRYAIGHEWFRACNVGELRDFLAQFHPDTPVLTEWEGVTRSLAFPELLSDFDRQGPALLFNVEYGAGEFSGMDGGAVTVPAENGPEDGQAMQE